MSSQPLDEEARTLLQAVVTGERAPEDPEVLARGARDPAFARRLEELRATAALLERSGHESRTIVSQAEALRGTPGERDWPGALRARRLPRPGLRRALWTGAAAAGIAVALFLAREDRPEDDDRLWMGEGTVHIVHPRGQVDRYAPIRWDGRLPPRGEYRITIEGSAAGTGATTTLEHRTTETQWTPSDADLSTLGARIRIDVSVFVDGQRVDGDSSEARR